MKLTNSPRLNKTLYDMDIHSYYDVLFHIPRKYEFHNLTDESTPLKDKDKVIVIAKLIAEPVALPSYKAKKTFFRVHTKKNEYNVLAYNQSYLEHTLKLDTSYILEGEYNQKSDNIILSRISEGESYLNHIEPLYSLPSSLKQFEYVRLVKKAFNELEGKIYTQVPPTLLSKYHLITKEIALSNVHFPQSVDDIRSGLLYLKYEEALSFSTKNKLIREENNQLSKIFSNYIEEKDIEKFIRTLPFKLTLDQQSAISEIIDDMNSSSLMYRLLQGDVGSGKTIVAFIALYANYLRGEQGVLLAPTETLARQHYENMLSIFSETKVNIKLLTGSLETEERRNILDDLRDGTIDILVGTHSLFSKSTVYSHLGLVIVDEQHRFGVNQRSALVDKGKEVDLLMMSATPIPRTLAQTILSDLSVSTLTTFPKRKRAVKTKLMKDEKKIFTKVQELLDNHQKVYVVAPVIDSDIEVDNNKALYERYTKAFPNLVSQLNGRMTSQEQEAALEAFKSGSTPILVATQVVELGIDVGDASCIIIYGSRRLGLSSLHQLRGRVGRNGQEAYCYLYIGKDYTDEEVTRLKYLTLIEDGFTLAELDLASRGPGELSGLRQSGLPDFKYLNVINDVKIFQSANKDADLILQNRDKDKGYSYYIERLEREIDYEGDIPKS
ncbi:MAG: ATP-dependent DNA helicase RecG [Coprobacillus sp.]|nr:ATP-dependent DNA helicase RecG [Coprobacillus sp.]